MRIKIIVLFACLILFLAPNLPARTAFFNLITDMFNQISIKPQEIGSMSAFAVGTMSIDRKEFEDPNDRFSWFPKEIITDSAIRNPIGSSPISLADGELKYNTFCNVCHGDTRAINKEGFADTKVNKLGMVAPAVISLTPQFTDGYIHQKIKYGGAVMPALGYATTDFERWNVVNYIRELEKKR